MTDDYKLTPTEDLILDQLATRIVRTGEQLWTFSTRFGKQLRHLQELGLLEFDHGVMENTYKVFLTDAGKRFACHEEYETPHQRLILEMRNKIDALDYQFGSSLSNHKVGAVDALDRALQILRNERPHP